MKKPMLLVGVMLCAATSLHAQRPMLIVNGVRVQQCETQVGNELTSQLGHIDEAAIENIEVLKGAAAAQQYGAEAVSGVIIVTTKKGSIVSPSVCGVPTITGADALTKFLYSPELVMAHQDAIALTDRQRAAIQDVVREVQSKALVDTQFKLGLAGEKLRSSLARNPVDESSVLQQIDEMLAFEREVKRAQITLLVRVKNLLTPEQRSALDKVR